MWTIILPFHNASRNDSATENWNSGECITTTNAPNVLYATQQRRLQTHCDAHSCTTTLTAALQRLQRHHDVWHVAKISKHVVADSKSYATESRIANRQESTLTAVLLGIAIEKLAWMSETMRDRTSQMIDLSEREQASNSNLKDSFAEK